MPSGVDDDFDEEREQDDENDVGDEKKLARATLKPTKTQLGPQLTFRPHGLEF